MLTNMFFYIKIKEHCVIGAENMVDVAQLVNASVCGTEDRGFESHLPPQLNIGLQPSGKASDFDSDMRQFESSQPSQKNNRVRREFGCFLFSFLGLERYLNLNANSFFFCFFFDFLSFRNIDSFFNVLLYSNGFFFSV